MRFSTRNASYLRVSNYRVIPLFLYLDERHVDWMSDRVLQLVIADLQPKMQGLLLQDRKQKKHKVQVERGDTYQYCYFLRTTTRTEVVLLKQKTFSLRPPSPSREPSPPPTASRKRKAPTRSSRSRTRSVSARRTQAADEEHDDEEEDVSEIVVKTEVDEDRWEPNTEEETSIKDWKPDVDVRYQGFGTSSVQLVIIVEPYPPLPSSEYAPPSSRLSSRSQSLSSYSRARTYGTGGTAGVGRYSSTSLSVARDGDANPRRTVVHAPNVRNATRSVSAAPRSGSVALGLGSGSATYGREKSATPGSGTGGRRGATPLFISRDTPFGEDEEDEEAHEAYELALREGRLRLPSVLGESGENGEESWEGDEELLDVPESMEDIGQRLVRSSQIEEGVIRAIGGWEEREAGEESAVMGREEPGD